MRIAVYAISKNEEQFVERWVKSASEADVLFIADTGSTDNTVAKAQALGVDVASITVHPWRFDDARNTSLALLPADVDWCIALDLDEELQPGWRQALEAAPENATRLRYTYTWNWNPDGTPGLQYGGDKIHRRHGYRWKHPVHEVAVKYDGPEVQAWIPMEIHHHADDTKPRSQYLPLLELSVKEDPRDERNLFYLGREYFSYGRYDEATATLLKYLEVGTWDAERCQAYRLLAKANPLDVVKYLDLATKSSPRREAYVDLAKHYHDSGDWSGCYSAATRALQITEKPLDYLCEQFAWGSAAEDYAAVSSYHLGLYELAYQYGQQALAKEPGNDRLQNNLRFYREKVDGDIRTVSG